MQDEKRGEEARSRLGGPAAPRGRHSYHASYHTVYHSEACNSYHADITVGAAEELGRDITVTQPVIVVNEHLLQAFREYCYSRYAKSGDARHRFNYFRRFWRIALNPIEITKLTPSQAKEILNALAAYRDFCSLYGIPFNVDLKQLRKLAPRQKKVKVLEYEEDKGIVQKALEQVGMFKRGSKYYMLALLSLFTGMRSTEIIYMVNNWEQLRKIPHVDAVIVEVGYERKSKKAWVTIIPKKLADLVPRIGKVGERAFDTMRDEYGFNVSIMRKAHLAILSERLKEHEINLLQGRIGKIIVKHYTKHLREIAEKYMECFAPYLHLLPDENEDPLE